MNQYQMSYMVVVFEAGEPNWCSKNIGPFTSEKVANAYATFIENVGDYFGKYNVCYVFKKTQMGRLRTYIPVYARYRGSWDGTAAPGRSDTHPTTPAGYPAPTENEIHGD